jgi:hypothetical protein
VFQSVLCLSLPSLVLGVAMEMKSVVYEPYFIVHVLMQNFLGTSFEFPMNMIIHKSLIFCLL